MTSRNSERDTNLWTILGIASREDSMTDLLAHCLEGSSQFRKRFAERVGLPGLEIDPSKIKTRKKVAPGCIPDLLLAGSEHALVVENKLKAGEGHAQREKYASEKARSGACDKLEIPTDSAVEFIYLTLMPPESPTQNKTAFTGLCYRELVDLFEGRYPELDENVHWMLSDFADLLRRFYARGDIGPSDQASNVLTRSGDPLDGSFLAFKRIMQAVDQRTPKHVEFRDPWIGNYSGRPTYSCQFLKQSWQPAKEIEWDAQTFDPHRHFSAHVEPMYYRLSGVLRIPIHFETYPYRAQDRLREHLGDEKFATTRELFEQFKRSIRNSDLKAVNGFSRRGGSIQAARFDVDIGSLTVEELEDQLAELVGTIEPHIDQALREINLIQ